LFFFFFFFKKNIQIIKKIHIKFKVRNNWAVKKKNINKVWSYNPSHNRQLISDQLYSRVVSWWPHIVLPCHTISASTLSVTNYRTNKIWRCWIRHATTSYTITLLLLYYITFFQIKKSYDIKNLWYKTNMCSNIFVYLIIIIKY